MSEEPETARQHGERERNSKMAAAISDGVADGTQRAQVKLSEEPETDRQHGERMERNFTMAAAIADGVADGTQRAQVKLSDRRLLVIYVVVVLFVVCAVVFVRASYENCRESNRGNASFDKILTQQITNVAASTTLNAEQKQQAISTYESARLSVVDCTRLFKP